jgi:hypothetical protein
MTTNFQIEEHYALICEGRHIDLHNNFDFIGYEYDVASGQIILKWTKSKGVRIKENEFRNLHLIHTHVTYLTISYDNKILEFPDDEKCLSDVSFFPSEDRQTNNRVVLQEIPKETDDIIYLFQTEHFIRIGCDKIELVCL